MEETSSGNRRTLRGMTHSLTRCLHGEWKDISFSCPYYEKYFESHPSVTTFTSNNTLNLLLGRTVVIPRVILILVWFSHDRRRQSNHSMVYFTPPGWHCQEFSCEVNLNYGFIGQFSTFFVRWFVVQNISVLRSKRLNKNVSHHKKMLF